MGHAENSRELLLQGREYVGEISGNYGILSQSTT